MKKIRFYCDIGFVRSNLEKFVEYPDDVTEEEIDRDFSIWFDNLVFYGWSECEEEEE